MSMTLEQVRDRLRELPGLDRVDTIDIHEMADAIDAHLAQPAQSVYVELVERLRKRAAEERQIAENNARVAELLSPELALFNAREGHNIYATRMAIDHRDSAKRDAAFADDLETAADKLAAALTEKPAQSVDVQWVETPPAESGWYWHWDGESYRMHFVFARPGHSYLCTEGEPYGPGQKRNFQAVQRMGGKWSSKVEPPPLRRQTRRRATGEG